MLDSDADYIRAKKDKRKSWKITLVCLVIGMIPLVYILPVLMHGNIKNNDVLMLAILCMAVALCLFAAVSEYVSGVWPARKEMRRLRPPSTNHM